MQSHEDPLWSRQPSAALPDNMQSLTTPDSINVVAMLLHDPVAPAVLDTAVYDVGTGAS